MKRSATKAEAITPAQYRAFQEAYDFFNAELFPGSLHHVLVTLQRHAKAQGYFSPDRFTARTEKAAAHELAMNPDSFTGRTDEEILSTLAHEMAHVWQQSHGTPPRRSYHDQQWAAKMKEIGLRPSDTGQVGGKETGQSVSHYIIPGGAYAPKYGETRCYIRDADGYIVEVKQSTDDPHKALNWQVAQPLNCRGYRNCVYPVLRARCEGRVPD